MINPFPIEDPDLDAAIASAHSDLKSHSADSDAYRAAVDQLSKLYKLRNEALKLHQEAQEFEYKMNLELEQHDYLVEQEKLPFYKRVSPDVVLTVAGNIAIGLFVVKYEQTGVISSKVMSFMKKI